MAKEKLENGNINTNGLLGTLGIGSIICMFCVVFLGLKLKWFRAQIKFGDSHIDKKREQPVQGVGFKLRANPDDYQSYKIISEFSSITESPQYPSTNQNFGIKPSQPPNKLIKSESIPNINTASSSNSTNKSPALISKSKSSTNLTQNIKETKIKSKKSPKSLVKSKSISKSNGNITVDASKTKEPQIAQNTIKLTANKTKLKTQKDKEVKSHKVSTPEVFNKNLSIKPEKHDAINIRPSVKPENRDNSRLKPEPPLQIRNPLGTDQTNTNKRPTKFEEENWEINFVDEKPKEIKLIDEAETNDRHFSSNTSSMYSSQAASIFFGGAPPVEPRIPKRNLITYDSDNESTGSQTNA